jgi:predicted secreted protein
MQSSICSSEDVPSLKVESAVTAPHAATTLLRTTMDGAVTAESYAVMEKVRYIAC